MSSDGMPKSWGGEGVGDERERFYSRLATLQGVHPMPSVGRWILLHVDHPSDLARKINRRLEPGTVSVPRHVPGAVRLPVRHPRENEVLFGVVKELTSARAKLGLDEEDGQLGVG